MRSWIAIGLGLMLAGCAPTETGNPSVTTKTGLTLSAYSSDPSRVSTEGEPGAIAVDRIWVSIASVDLDPCDGQPRATAIAGPFFEDLAHRPRPVHDLDTDLDRFCGLAMGTTPAAHDPDGGASEIVGRTIVVHGQRTDSVPFLISSARVATSVLVVPDGVALADEPRRFLLAFDAAHLVSSLDFAAAVVGSDGTILVDTANNSTLLASFEAGIDASISLHHDLDRDGDLDPNESTRINH